jgi:hypothetical protein
MLRGPLSALDILPECWRHLSVTYLEKVLIRTVAEDGVISITVGGTNDNGTATAKVTILIAY